MTETTAPLTEVRCRGCRRRMGVGNGSPERKLWCTQFCANQPPVTDNEFRDSMIETLARLKGWRAMQIHVNFDITRARADQILKQRLVR